VVPQPSYENLVRALEHGGRATDDDLTVLVGTDRPATRQELEQMIAEVEAEVAAKAATEVTSH
jgi:hypothetical protein